MHSLRHTSVTYKLKLNGRDIKATQGDSGHSQSNRILNVYSYTLDDDRRKNAELFEKAFYEKKELEPDIHQKMPENTLQMPEGVDPELLGKVLADPEMAALLADESPVRWSRVFCTRWNGINKSGGMMDALDDAEYSGSIISLIENGEAFIKRNNRVMWRKTDNSREEMPEYVERSCHEALINGLAHRDYLINGSEVHIDIYDGRMEIYSPGGMPDGSLIQERDPLTVPSTRRNPVLADVLNRLGYMERKGSGLEKIISGVTKDNLDDQILSLIRKDSRVSTRKMAERLGVNVRTINRHLKKMDHVNYIGRGSNGIGRF